MNTYHYDMEVTLYVNEEIVAESQEQADAILEALLDNDDYLDHDMHDLVVDRNDADIESHQVKVTNCNVWPDFEEEGARERAIRYLGEEVYGRETRERKPIPNADEILAAVDAVCGGCLYTDLYADGDDNDCEHCHVRELVNAIRESEE